MSAALVSTALLELRSKEGPGPAAPDVLLVAPAQVGGDDGVEIVPLVVLVLPHSGDAP